MKTLNEITETELKTIFEASYRKRDKVTQFGKTIDNPNLTNVDDPTLIDTLDLLRDLHSEALEVYDMTALDMHNLEGTNFEYIEDLKEVDYINTYNWAAPLSNDLDIKIYKDEDKMYLLTSVQNGYSDARCGYMIEFLFIIDTNYSSDDWTYLLSDLPSAYKSFTNSNGYSFDFNLFDEGGVYNVYKDGHEEYDVYIGDYEDCESYTFEEEEV